MWIVKVSKDDAIFIQQTMDGGWAAQWGTVTADAPPNPNTAPTEKTYNTLAEAILEHIEVAEDTRYGFRFPNLQGYGYGPRYVHPQPEALFEL